MHNTFVSYSDSYTSKIQNIINALINMALSIRILKHYCFTRQSNCEQCWCYNVLPSGVHLIECKYCSCCKLDVLSISLHFTWWRCQISHLGDSSTIFFIWYKTILLIKKMILCNILFDFHFGSFCILTIRVICLSLWNEI